MRPRERQQLLLERLNQRGDAKFPDLATEFGVSEMTVRRDLDHLERGGHVRLIRGGAISRLSRAYEPSLSQRQSSASPAKVAIGQAAAALVGEGDTVAVDVGSTTLELARALHGKALTVVTPSLLVALDLAADDRMRVVVTGGQVRMGEFSLTGGMAEDAFRGINCDLAFIAVAGVRTTPGFTEFNLDDARIKQAAIRAARRVVVVADATKFGRVAFCTVASFAEVDVLVTDAPESDKSIVAARGAGIEIVHATPAFDSAEQEG